MNVPAIVRDGPGRRVNADIPDLTSNMVVPMTQALQTIEQEPVVYIRDGQIFANSFDVATYFEKEHRVILQAADRLVEADPGCLAYLCKSPLRVAQHNGGVRIVQGYEMTENGFALVGMGLTGSKAVAFKLRYLAAFNAMKEELKRRNAAPVVDLNDPAFLRQALLGYTEKVIALENKVEEQTKAIAVIEPKARFYDEFADSDGLVTLRDIGRVLKTGPDNLIKWMLKERLLFRTAPKKPLRARNEFVKKGWFEMKVTVVDGEDRIQTYATPKGIQGVAELMGRPVDMFGRIDTSQDGRLLRH